MLTDYDPRLGGDDVYSSYQEYLDDSIKELKNNTPVTDIGLYSAEEFIVFDYNEGKAATLRTGLYGQVNMGKLVDNESVLREMGFEQFYPEVFDDFSIENFIEAHLLNAGVEDESYIQSYIEDWKADWNTQR